MVHMSSLVSWQIEAFNVLGARICSEEMLPMPVSCSVLEALTLTSFSPCFERNSVFGFDSLMRHETLQQQLTPRCNMSWLLSHHPIPAVMGLRLWVTAEPNWAANSRAWSGVEWAWAEWLVLGRALLGHHDRKEERKVLGRCEAHGSPACFIRGFSSVSRPKQAPLHVSNPTLVI
ncbi:hypothetical protein VTI74DRAFT_4907 [Chaetomium olivicolor]